MEFAPLPPDYVVTLIHGTFARRAPWVHSDTSFLRQRLVEQLAPATVEFAPFVWSGRNSHTARIAGGLALRRALRERVRQFPAARHLLIAHSHGGNVAVYGLRGFTGADRVSGLICLGTPFIRCAPHPLAEIAAAWRRGTGRVLFICLLIALVCAAMGAWGGNWRVVVTAVLAAFVGCYLGCRRLFAHSGPAVRRWGRLQDKLVRRLAAPAVLPVPCLCVWTKRDEARYALAVADTLPRVFGWTMWLARYGTLALFLLSLIGGPIGTVLIWLNPNDGFKALILTIALILVWIIVTPVLFVALLAVRAAGPMVTAVTSWVVRVAGYGGGIGSGSYSLLAVRQDLQPAGFPHLTEMSFDLRARLRDWFRLQHSRLYDSPEVLAKIAEWIRQPPDTAQRTD